MLAVAFECPAEVLRNPQHAGALLRLLGERIPSQRRHRAKALSLPADLAAGDLSHPSLSAAIKDEGRLQLGTLGGGNHFIELQADEEDRLWLMIHSGSRAMGQVIKAHHVARAEVRSSAMAALDAETDAGRAYLQDQAWACRYAAANRAAMSRDVIQIMKDLFRIEADESSTIACDHNHVRREEHFGQMLLVHRKGAMPAGAAMPGVVPGSMGTWSYHVEGRGCAESLRSSAHGAGRLLSRHAARERFGRADLRRQMEGVWYDPRGAGALREESPRSYKDVRAVMRAQSDLVRIARMLRPLLVYKGR